MQRKMQTIISAVVLLLMVTGLAALAQQEDRKTRPGQAQPQGAFPPPSGNGTPGQITKWTSYSTLGDSVISEDKFGKIGVGTTTPGSRLTVAGMVETTTGGVKYPDGTVQTTAAVSGLSAVAHDNTLTGNGTQVSPLSVVATDPAKQPFTQVVAAGSSSSLEFHVPQGKRLVIEQVSGSGAIVSGAKFLTVGIEVSALVNGVVVPVFHYFVPQVIGEHKEGSNLLEISAFSQPCRIYVEPGGVVAAGVDITGSPYLYSMTVSGYLVDVP